MNLTSTQFLDGCSSRVGRAGVLCGYGCVLVVCRIFLTRTHGYLLSCVIKRHMLVAKNDSDKMPFPGCVTGFTRQTNNMILFLRAVFCSVFGLSFCLTFYSAFGLALCTAFQIAFCMGFYSDLCIVFFHALWK